jgi:hypothetical protein
MNARTLAASMLSLVPPVVVACSGGGGGGASSGSSDLTATCGDLYAAYVGCSLVAASSSADDVTRFEQACALQATLPGSSATAAEIEACAQSLKGDCSHRCALPTTGTLAAGAACNPGFGSQCQSGTCVQVRGLDGGYPTCGVCSSVIAVGQPCNLDPTATCVTGSFCVATSPTSSTGTCTAYGGAGAPCTNDGACDQSSFFCSTSTGQCTAYISLGATCSASGQCVDESPCVGGVCAAPATAGQACTPTGLANPCAGSLVCNAATSTCVVPAAGSGEPCGSNGQECLEGECTSNDVCPVVVPDGQPCPDDPAHTCDVFADCNAAGLCAIGGVTSCQ